MKIYLNFVFVGDEIWMIKITIQTSARVILGSRKRKKKNLYVEKIMNKQLTL